MGRSITLAELRARVLRAADMQRQNVQGYAQLDVADLINESVAALHDLLVASFEDYFLVSATLAVPPRTTPDVTLPADFYKVRSVTSGPVGSPTQLGPFTEDQRPDMLAGCGYGYQVAAGTIALIAPDATVLLRYIPQPPYLVLDTDTLSFAIVPGWETYVVCDAASALVAKADRDPSMLADRRDRVKARITEMALRRDAGRTHHIQDVYGWSCVNPAMPAYPDDC